MYFWCKNLLNTKLDFVSFRGLILILAAMKNLLIVALLMVLGGGQAQRYSFTEIPMTDSNIHIDNLIVVIEGYLHRAETRFKEIMKIKQLVDTESMDERAAFEKGFLMGEIIDTYRKALIFTEKQMVKGRYLESDRIRYLMYVQNAYIKTFHLVHMMHEINAKYNGDNTGQIMKVNLETHKLDKTYDNLGGFNYAKELNTIRDKLIKERNEKVEKEHRIRQFELQSGDVLLTSPTSKKRADWFPLQYGWDMDYYW